MIPQMGTTLLSFGSDFTVAVISKSPGTGDSQFEIQETFEQMRRIHGTKIPTPPQKLDYIVDGMWKWIYWDFYTTETDLNLDDMLMDKKGLQYRIMAMERWEEAGFRIYTLQQQTPAGGIQ